MTKATLWPRRAAPRAPQVPVAPLLLTLGALLVCLTPFVSRLPLWTSALLALLLAYRAGVALKRIPALTPLLQTTLLGVVVVGCAVGLQQHFGTLLGRDGGSAALVVLLALKVVETRTRRDLQVLALLGFFVTVIHFFFAQDTLTLLHALLSLALLCAALALNERLVGGGDVAAPPKVNVGWAALVTALRPAAGSLLQALPLALALFLLFPRPDSPLWQMPVSASAQSSSGLSDTVNPGGISSLALSDEVAFRAAFDGKVPPPSELYWRGPVMEFFDGEAWRALKPVRAPVQLSASGEPYAYTLTLEPHGRAWVLALDAPVSLPAGTTITQNLQVIKPSLVGARTRLRLNALTHYRYGVDASEAWLARNLQLPGGGNPRSRELAQGWRTLAPAQRVQAGLAVFGRGDFAYTLNPPPIRGFNALDDFIFHTKRGFCEHYASAFAYLMRAAGVPARVVTGYQGAEANGPYFIVRQANAHAWAEVWLAGQGWVRVDPTALVSPERLTRGVQAISGAPALAGEGSGAFKALSLRLDALQNLWNTWVIGYDGAQQRQLFSTLGLGDVGGWKVTLFGGVALLLSALPLLLGRRPRLEPLSAAYALLSRRLRLPRLPAETASAYADRAAELYPAQAGEIRALIGQYQSLRYAPLPSGSVEAFARAVRAFKLKR